MDRELYLSYHNAKFGLKPNLSSQVLLKEFNKKRKKKKKKRKMGNKMIALGPSWLQIA